MSGETVPDKERLGANLARCRKKAGFASYASVERALGWTLRKYENYEKGRTAPNYSAIWEMAELFGVSCDELIGFETSRENEPPLKPPAPKQVLARLSEDRRAAILAAVRKACAVTATQDDVLDAADLLLARLRERAN